jgi:hypothetical protein
MVNWFSANVKKIQSLMSKESIMFLLQHKHLIVPKNDTHGCVKGFLLHILTMIELTKTRCWIAIKCWDCKCNLPFMIKYIVNVR